MKIFIKNNPQANFSSIIFELEKPMLALGRNFHMPLVLINLLLELQKSFRAMKNYFYITTPIYYVNDKPHIGHAYTTILADVISRYKRKLGKRNFFLTGLDEHGQKVQEAAEKLGVDPKKHCDKMAPRFTSLWDKLHISNDDFIRTTEDRHKKIVKKILQIVMENGDIYEAEYEGLYSVSEERFITEKESESGVYRDIKTLKEKNYFFSE